MDIQNTHCMVVGASSGMGKATAALLHKNGAHVIMVGRDKQRLEAAAGSIDPTADRMTLIEADMTNAADRERIFTALPALDHLVVTAADLVYKTVEAFTEQDVQKVLASKIVAPFFLAQQAARLLPKNGSITFVSGIAAERPLPTGVMTGTVNGGLYAMVRGLAVALAPARVNTVSPGWVDSPLWNDITDDAGKRQAFEAMAQKIPARRIGEPEDIAQAILSVMTNGFITGSTVYVDGGQRLV